MYTSILKGTSLLCLMAFACIMWALYFSIIYIQIKRKCFKKLLCIPIVFYNWRTNMVRKLVSSVLNSCTFSVSAIILEG
uniref:Uncharacterized protein n=1 Tax=Setaria italica TaxID=4555 RepID=K3Z310_SETIT